MCLWYEWMVSWMWMCLQANGGVNGQWMEWMWLCCTSSVQRRLKTELFSVAMKHIYIYYDRSVCERPEREKTGIKSVRLQDSFRLHWNQQHYIFIDGGSALTYIWVFPVHLSLVCIDVRMSFVSTLVVRVHWRTCEFCLYTCRWCALTYIRVLSVHLSLVCIDVRMSFVSTLVVCVHWRTYEFSLYTCRWCALTEVVHWRTFEFSLYTCRWCALTYIWVFPVHLQLVCISSFLSTLVVGLNKVLTFVWNYYRQE